MPGSGSGIAIDGKLAATVLGAAFVVLAAFKLRSGLAPGSLFLDDEWVALALRDAGLGERIALNLPMPIGFSLLAGVPVALAPASHLALQVVPVLAYLGTVASLPVLVFRLSRSPWAAALGAAIIATAPLTAEFAVRAKQYTLDQLVTVGVLLAMVGLFRAREPRRLLGAAIALASSVVLSYSSLFLVTAVLVTASVRVWVAPRWGTPTDAPPTSRQRLQVTAVASSLLVAVGAFLLLYVRRASRAVMSEYWVDYFPSWHGWTGVWAFLSVRAREFVLFALPDWAWIFALVAPLGFVWLWRHGHREYAVALALFYGLVLAAAATHSYPMGIGRTDMYAGPVTTLLICLGILELVHWIRSVAVRHLVFAALLASFTISLAVSPGPVYPETDDRGAVQRALERLGDGDALVLSPYAAFALGYYGMRPSRLVPVDYYGHGFDVAFDRPRTLTTAFGRWDVQQPRAVATERERLAAFVNDAPSRLIYLETQSDSAGRAATVRTIVDGGFRLAASTRFGGRAEAFVFERRS